MFRAPGAHGKQPPRRPPAPGPRCPPGRHGAATAPLRVPPGRAGPGRCPAPAAAGEALQPSTKNASKQRRGQTRTRGSLPAANRIPAGFKPVSQGRRFPEVTTGRCSPADPRARSPSLPSAPEPCSPGGHRLCPAAAPSEPSRAEPGRGRAGGTRAERPRKAGLTCMCRVLWTARVLDWQKPFPHSWHLKGFSLEWMYLKGNPWGEQRCRRRVGHMTPNPASPNSTPSQTPSPSSSFLSPLLFCVWLNFSAGSKHFQ